MKRVGLSFLAVILSLTLVITPVMAKGGGGSSGNGNSGGSSKAQSTANGNSGSNKAAPSNQGQSKNDSKVSSNNKTTGKLDLTKGNKESVKQRLETREEKSVKKQFKDTEDHWAQNNIQKVQQLGLITGYEDGSFSPDSEVRQVEAMVMVVNLAELIDDENLTDETGTNDTNTSDETVTTDNTTTDETGTDTTVDETTDETPTDDEEAISDVPSWARNQARKASLGNIVNINRFHSQVQASRAQVAVMLAKALELTPVEVDENAFTDTMLIAPEDVGYILALKEAGVIAGTTDNKFNPNKGITRAEIATMLANVVDSIEDEEETPGDGTTDPGDGSVTDPTGDDTGDNTTPTDETVPDTGTQAPTDGTDTETETPADGTTTTNS